MDPIVIYSWLKIVSSSVALITVSIGALWAYTKYVLEKSLLPPVDFTVKCNPLGKQNGKQIIEILLHLKNVGISTLVAKDIQIRLRYLNSTDAVSVLSDPAKPTFGRVNFIHSHSKEIGVVNAGNGPTVIPFLKYNTFVQPGVDQIYTLVTALPDSVSFVLLLAQFQYNKKPSRFQVGIIKLSRQLGLIQYSLHRVSKPHTVERAYNIGYQERTPDT